MAILKKCNHIGCNKLIDVKESYCDEHKQDSKQRYKDYRKKRLEDKEEVERQQLYSSAKWRKCRDSIVVRDKGCCSLCLLEEGRLEPIYTVHHIRELREYKEGALLSGNLIGLCQHHHIEIHRQYNLSEKDKEKEQQKLFKLNQLSLVEIFRLWKENNKK